MIFYQNIAKEVLLKSLQMVGGDTAARETAFATNWNTATFFDGVRTPVSALKQIMLRVEKNLWELVSMSNNTQWQMASVGVTVNLANNTEIPRLDTNNAELIGSFLGCFDSANNSALTEQPKQIIKIRNRQTAFFTTPSEHFCLDAGRLYHTVTSAYLKGIIWNQTARQTQIDNYATGTSALPAELETLFLYEVLASLSQEDWFINESVGFANMAQAERNKYFEMKQIGLNNKSIQNSTVNAEPTKN